MYLPCHQIKLDARITRSVLRCLYLQPPEILLQVHVYQNKYKKNQQ